MDAVTVRELLAYDPVTGIFSWRRPPRRGVAAGPTGCKGKAGYIEIGWRYEKHYAHRLAWLHVYGVWPIGEIDHINGVRDDNRLANLRDVARDVNNQNKRKPATTNKTGFLGVHPKRKRFTSQINAGGKTLSLGVFDTPEQAHAAYIEAKRRLHPGGTL